MEFPFNEGITKKRPKLAQNRYGHLLEEPK